MPTDWIKGLGREFSCPHCGSVYAVTLNRYPSRNLDGAKCEICGKIMKAWDDTASPSFTLKIRADIA
jgi:predicted Zn finger-like uncharacterized protein